MSRALPGSVLITGPEATKAALLARISTCGILHVATHGYADPDYPEFSGLLLAGTEEKRYEILTAQEVARCRLQARLVTLSACQTAMGKDVEGEGILGLTRSFLIAGAQDVVCSLWPVSDESTNRLMQHFYAQVRKGEPVEVALQSAQQALMQVPTTSHPFYWAAFITVRGSR